MGLFDFLFSNKNKSSEFDEYCENCGELLEDCECDDQWLSKQDISQEIEFYEMMEDDEDNF